MKELLGRRYVHFYCQVTLSQVPMCSPSGSFLTHLPTLDIVKLYLWYKKKSCFDSQLPLHEYSWGCLMALQFPLLQIILDPISIFKYGFIFFVLISGHSSYNLDINLLSHRNCKCFFLCGLPFNFVYSIFCQAEVLNLDVVKFIFPCAQKPLHPPPTLFNSLLLLSWKSCIFIFHWAHK